MKASMLIEKLQEVIECYGDLEVGEDTCSWGIVDLQVAQGVTSKYVELLSDIHDKLEYK